MATIGYSRVSTTDQHPEAQAARLRGHCCARIFTDHGVSGKTATRPHGPAEQLETGDDRRVAEVLVREELRCEPPLAELPKAGGLRR